MNLWAVARRAARTRYATDVVVALLVLIVLYVPLMLPATGQPGQFSPWAWVFMAGAALPLIVRRRFPVVCLLTINASLVAYNTLDKAASEPIAWGLLVAIYSIAWVGRRIQLILVIVLISGISVATVRSPATAMIGFLTGIAALVLGAVTRRREQRMKDLAYRAGQHERDKELEAARAVATERARIARDMHDVLAHAVSVMIVQAEAGPVVVHANPERAERAFDAIANAGREAMEQLRRALGMLKDDPPPQPAVASIASLVAGVEETGLATSYVVTGVQRSLTPDGEIAAYRIVQEALTNTLKHAAATKVSVALEWGECLSIMVRDDGTGKGGLGGAGNGLIGIRERAAACGGTVSARAGEDGFTVRASLPVGST
jgi:signal transduction histidine kinase